MKFCSHIALLCLFLLWMTACSDSSTKEVYGSERNEITPDSILGHPDYLAISYGGFRALSRDTVSSIEDLKEDLRILSALGIKILRTYHTQLFDESARLLQAIDELKQEEKDFEMYVMLGIWMECEDAFTDHPRHMKGNDSLNQKEMQAGIALARRYPQIVKIIAVGNESMVHWAPYHVNPKVILQYVKKLQELKRKDSLAKDIWITSSDNFASWGGGGKEYQVPALDSLIMEVDYISVHSYPFHDTHYNPDFWLLNDSTNLKGIDLVDSAMAKAVDYAFGQVSSVKQYAEKLRPEIEVHIGETGWASVDNDLYGTNGSHAADEYKQKLYYQGLRKGSNAKGMSCFFFEAFDEIWKDAKNPRGSENHFGLFTLNGKAKYAIWDAVNDTIFSGLKRNGNPIKKSFNGSDSLIRASVLLPFGTKEY